MKTKETLAAAINAAARRCPSLTTASFLPRKVWIVDVEAALGISVRDQLPTLQAAGLVLLSRADLAVHEKAASSETRDGFAVYHLVEVAR